MPRPLIPASGGKASRAGRLAHAMSEKDEGASGSCSRRLECCRSRECQYLRAHARNLTRAVRQITRNPSGRLWSTGP